MPADEVPHVSALRQHLQKICGVPRFRQRLLHAENLLEEDDKLYSDMILQLVVVPFAAASVEEQDMLRSAALHGQTRWVELALWRPQDPDLTGSAKEQRARALARTGSTPLQAACIWVAVKELKLSYHNGYI